MSVPGVQSDLYQYDEEFRNTIATVDEKGKRIWIYPKKPSGNYYRWRVVFTIALLLLFFAGPFVTLHGRPLLLFNILERRFIIFGQAFWPQDFFLLALTLIILFVFIALFTVAFGRLWCGWACPQTLFMEMVFRKIEYWIEGDANDQRRLNQAPWTPSKVIKKTSKQLIFILISLLIAHVVMAYIIGWQEVRSMMSHVPYSSGRALIGLTIFSGIFYFAFAYFREQVCIAVCPYGRLQGVLLVKESIVVIYDWLRGEPRGKIRKHPAPTEAHLGDCIDCKLCVHVCPTGIDIRHGTQLECVNCTACMDACDEVMVKIHKPKGLIRYSSFSAIAEGKQKLFTARVIAYSCVLAALLGLLGYFVFTRTDIQTTVLKAPGTLYSKTEDGMITNLYTVEFVNKTFDDIQLELKVESPATASLLDVGGPEILVPKEGMLKKLVMVKIPPDQITAMRIFVDLGVYQNGQLVEVKKAKFIGPLHKKAQKDN